MKAAAILIAAALLAGCASAPVAYDEQFCTMKVRQADGRVRCVAWTIGRIR